MFKSINKKIDKNRGKYINNFNSLKIIDVCFNNFIRSLGSDYKSDDFKFSYSGGNLHIKSPDKTIANEISLKISHLHEALKKGEVNLSKIFVS